MQSYYKQSTLKKMGNGPFLLAGQKGLNVYSDEFKEPRVCERFVYLRGLTATGDGKSGLLVKLMCMCYFRVLLQRIHIPSVKKKKKRSHYGELIVHHKCQL